MWIERLEIDGFGRLRGTFRFNDALTLVTGPNESGKSTLHRALMRSAFGFSPRERRRYGGSSTLTDCEPWTGPPFGLKALISCDERRLRAAWAFNGEDSKQELRLIDEDTGEDLTSEVAEKHGDTGLGRYLLGLDYEEFCQICVLEQAAIGAVESSDGLVDSLRRAAEVGSADTGVDLAREILSSALRDEAIGVRTDNLAPVGGKRLQRCLTETSEIEANLAEAEETRSELSRLAVELAGYRDRQRHIHPIQLATEQQLLRLRAHALEERVANAADAQSKATFEPDESVALDNEAVRQIEAGFTRRDELAEGIAGLAPAAQAARGTAAEISALIAGCDQCIREVEAYREVDGSSRDETARLVGRIEELDRANLPASSELQARESRTPWLIAAAIIATSSIAGALAVGAVALVGLVVAGALAVIARTRRPPDQDDLRDSQDDRKSEVGAQLQATLDAVGAPPATDLRMRAANYLDACTRRSNYDALAGERAEHERHRAEASKPENESRRLAGELGEVERSLGSDLAQLGIGSTDLDKSRGEFEKRVAEAAEEARLAEQASGAKPALKAALGNRTLGQLTDESETVGQKLREHVAQHGELAAQGEDLDVLEEQLNDLGREERDLNADIRKLEALVDEREEALAPVPGLREQLHRLGPEIDRIRMASEAISIARSGLERAASAAHRRIAPILNKAIAEDLPTITGGRYRTARISEELEITLETPETGESVAADLLSRGTQDQIFLVQRLAILEMLGGDNPRPPLLLDDVFVHFDDERLPFGLELLRREAEQRQVVIFAGDNRVRAGFDDAGIDHGLIALEPPTSPDLEPSTHTAAV